MKLQLEGKPELKCIYFEPVKTKQTIGLVFGSEVGNSKAEYVLRKS